MQRDDRQSAPQRDLDDMASITIVRVGDQQVQAAGRNPLGVGEVPCGAADHAAGVLIQEGGVGLDRDLLPRHPGPVALLGDSRRIDTGADDARDDSPADLAEWTTPALPELEPPPAAATRGELRAINREG